MLVEASSPLANQCLDNFKMYILSLQKFPYFFLFTMKCIYRQDRSHHGVGDKPMSCNQGAQVRFPASPSLSDETFKLWFRLLRRFKTRTTAGEPSGAPGQITTKAITHPTSTGYSQRTRPQRKYRQGSCDSSIQRRISVEFRNATLG